MTFFPPRAKSNARRESNTTSPTAAPGDAGMPVAIGFIEPARSN